MAPQTGTQAQTAAEVDADARFDAVIVGAGFAGLYMLHSLRKLGMTARIYEQADNVGGTWYWNRYPGARCDAESLAYSYSFDPDLEQQWEWSERYATQPEILRYIEHVAERLDLRRDIRFERRVSAAHFDETGNEWRVHTEAGDSARAPLLIMAVGCLSVPLVPDIPGLDDFRGNRYQASMWPHEGVDFSGQVTGVIGTGSSAIQAIPVIAEQAKELIVFQRTPNFSVPAVNGPLDPDFVREFKAHYREHRQHHKLGLGQGFGDLAAAPSPGGPVHASGDELTEQQIRDLLDRYWQVGGAHVIGVIGDTLANERTNQIVADYVRDRIRKTVKDPATAESLCPTSHPIGSKRICVDTDYFETYNRDNVKLVDLKKTPIERVTATGIQVTGAHYELDTLVLATGFDAMTGAFERIDIRGRGGRRLADAWQAGPRTCLGLAVHGFPNLFTITGPGSPSVLSNMIVSIEQHVDWIIGCIAYMREHGFRCVEPTAEAQDNWVQHVNEVADMTLFPRGGSWYLGANVPGKPRVFMPYAGGVGPYREICDGVENRCYEGFEFA